MRYFLGMSNNINDKTNVPLFAVICAVPFFLGGVLWLATIDAKATQARDDLTGIKPLTIDIRERQIKLEQMVQDLINQQGRNRK